jgi:2,4-dienoyl-CoA reductase-like NADH-dependent reductase (Old Yellow Enzyme family)
MAETRPTDYTEELKPLWQEGEKEVDGKRKAMSHLFSPLRLRDLTFKNRVFVSPMCQYSAVDGVPGTWHTVHLGSRAVGGAALVMTEATSISPEGRISPGDTGIWNEAQENAFAAIARFLRDQGAVAGMQLAHAGRKASISAPWLGGKALEPDQGGWEPQAPSAVRFAEGYLLPHELGAGEIDQLVEQFLAGARRAHRAGFQLVELHAAHGYLLHEFLSPLSNLRTDEYGGSLDNRCRLTVRIAKALRDFWPQELPLFVRISASDWVEGGWDVAQSVQLCRQLKAVNVDLIDCSSGGNVAKASIPNEPGYQVPFAEEIRRSAGIPTGAVGLITEPAQAENILCQEQADAIFLARELLRDPYWPLHAAHALGDNVNWPVQYQRAKPH